jgi:biopolymer transport protein ExbB/TolQ
MPAVSRVTSFSEWLLRQSLIWGGLACLAFYATVVQGAEEGTFLHRYFAAHPINYCTTAMFFVGVASLVIKLFGLGIQFAMLNTVQLPTEPSGTQTVDEAKGLLQSLKGFSSSLNDSYLVRRLREALEFVQRKGSADTLEDQLRHLEDNDRSRMYNSYGLVRIAVATIPILGFLGTVVGIALAIGQLNLAAEALDESLPAVVAGLSVAFDTTGQSLSLSLIILCVKFLVERVEFRLLSRVDDSAAQQLIGRFQQYGTKNDPHLASIAMMSEQLLKTMQLSVVKQSELLHNSLEKTGQQWSEILLSTASTLDETLSSAVAGGMSRHAEALNQGVHALAEDLEETLVRHAELLNEGLQHHTASLIETESKLAEENRRHLADVEAAVGEAMLLATNRQEKLIKQSEDLLKEMQVALVEAAGTTVAQQEQLIKQGDILLKVVEATGQVKKLEETLNGNLSALAGAHNFQQTVAGLSAVLQLLGARLGGTLPIHDVDLTDQRRQNQAA